MIDPVAQLVREAGTAAWTAGHTADVQAVRPEALRVMVEAVVTGMDRMRRVARAMERLSGEKDLPPAVVPILDRLRRDGPAGEIAGWELDEIERAADQVVPF